MERKKENKKKGQTNRPIPYASFFLYPDGIRLRRLEWWFFMSFLRESSVPHYTHTLSVHHTFYHLHACQERHILDIEQVVRCIPVYPRPTSRRISI